MFNIRPISNTTVVTAARSTVTGMAHLRRASDDYVFTTVSLPSIDAVRRTWHAFIENQPGAEDVVERFDPAAPDNDFLNAWQACVDSKPWEASIDIFGGDL